MSGNAEKGSNMPQTVLRLPTVKARTGLSRSTIYLRIAQRQFPRSISLGPRAVGWLESEISEWLERRIAQRRDSTSDRAAG
jgi:prophage regulatory protein